MATDDLMTSEARGLESMASIGSDMAVTFSGESVESRRHLYIIDSLGREVHLGDRKVRLTSREFNLLVYLLGRRGETVSRCEFLRCVWDGAFGVGSRTVDVHVQRLRKKLGDALELDTVRGVGYRLR